MRYCDKDLNVEITSPASQISYIIILILFAPIRFFSEMGKRLLLLGEYTRLLLNLCLLLNASLIFISILNSYCITKIFNIWHGTLNLVALLISFVFNLLLNIFCRLNYNVNLDNLGNLSKEDKLSTIDKIHSQYKVNLHKEVSDTPFKKNAECRNNKAAEKFLEDYKTGNREETLEEKIKSGKMDAQSKEDVMSLSHELKKTLVSPVYKYEKEEADKIMFDGLREKLVGRVSERDDEARLMYMLAHATDKEYQAADGFSPEAYDRFMNNQDLESDLELDPNDEVMEAIAERKIEEARAMCRGEFDPNSIEAQLMMQDLDEDL